MDREGIHAKFTKALDGLVGQVQRGSLDSRGDPVRQPVARYGLGEVRHRSRARDDRRQEGRSQPTWRSYADGVNVHAFLMPRAEFRKTVEGSVRNSFMHSLLAKGRLLYTHDQTIADSVRRSARSASATRQSSFCARRRRRCRRSTRRTSGSSRAAISTTRRSGSSTRPRRWRRSR